MEPLWQFSAPQVAATRIGLLNNQINKHKHTILTEIATVAGVLNEMKFCWRKHTEKAQNGDMVLLTITHQNTKTFTVFFSQQPRPKISYESALDEKNIFFFVFVAMIRLSAVLHKWDSETIFRIYLVEFEIFSTWGEACSLFCEIREATTPVLCGCSVYEL